MAVVLEIALIFLLWVPVLRGSRAELISENLCVSALTYLRIPQRPDKFFFLPNSEPSQGGKGLNRGCL